MSRLLWVFIVLVTILDIEFALHYLDSIQEWEVNPAMRWVVAHLGIQAACCFRMGTVMVACLLCLNCKTPVGKAGTATAFILHLYLAAAYAAMFLLWGAHGPFPG